MGALRIIGGAVFIAGIVYFAISLVMVVDYYYGIFGDLTFGANRAPDAIVSILIFGGLFYGQLLIVIGLAVRPRGRGIVRGMTWIGIGLMVAGIGLGTLEVYTFGLSLVYPSLTIILAFFLFLGGIFALLIPPYSGWEQESPPPSS